MKFCCFGSLVEGADNTNHSQYGFSPSKNFKIFSYKELKSATKNFDASCKIGRGGFGTVYVGTLKDGTQVAVKSLSAESKQGINEFLTEIDMVANVRHPNLVELIGCCVEGGSRILIYEYLENNSLERILLGSKSKMIELNWHKRTQICMGTAKGLAFLHDELEPHIVHRDIKASNILLDRNLVPKIGDFGLAKLFPNNVTHISTRVAGTIGYLAPEYAMRGQLTKMADIYSFGVLLLEIVSGRSSGKKLLSGAQKFLLEWTWELYKEGKLLELVDPQLVGYPKDDVLLYIKVALFCTQAAAKRRPSMTEVIAMLSKQIQLNEKRLTSPGIIQDMEVIGVGSRGTTSSNSQTPPTSSPLDSSPIFSASKFSSSSLTITQMAPR